MPAHSRKDLSPAPRESILDAVTVCTFHLAQLGYRQTARTLLRPPTARQVDGLHHAECMIPMRLGAPVIGTSRWQADRLAVFAIWENERAIDTFMVETAFGRALATGWHLRLQFLRRWGYVAEIGDLLTSPRNTDPDAPVVAVTLARLELSQAPRFVHWGKPVESLVRDHPGVVLALAAARPWNTISTFSVWRNAREMVDMVHGRSAVAAADRHAAAMVERDRRDFHHEFTTLRFTCIGEYGSWQGHSSIVPL